LTSYTLQPTHQEKKFAKNLIKLIANSWV